MNGILSNLAAPAIWVGIIVGIVSIIVHGSGRDLCDGYFGRLPRGRQDAVPLRHRGGGDVEKYLIFPRPQGRAEGRRGQEGSRAPHAWPWHFRPREGPVRISGRSTSRRRAWAGVAAWVAFLFLFLPVGLTVSQYLRRRGFLAVTLVGVPLILSLALLRRAGRLGRRLPPAPASGSRPGSP